MRRSRGNERLLRRVGNRIANLAARAVVQLVDDTKKLQLLQIGVLAGEDLDDAEHFQQYGFSSNPLVGAEAVVVFPGGDRAHPLVVAVDDRRYRPTGSQPGEVVVYNHTGAQVRFTAAGDIAVTPAPSRAALLGGAAAVDAVIKGTARNTAEQTFLTAMDTFIALMVDAAGPNAAARTTFRAAITAFKAAAAAALSAKVKTE